MVDFVQGSLIWISLTGFFLGLVLQVIRFLALTQRKERIFLNLEVKKEAAPAGGGTGRIQGWITFLLRRTVLGTHPTVIIVSYLFHCLVFIVPLFLLGHNILLRNSLGISLWSFPESVSDTLTILLLIGGVFFLLRRLFLSRVRAITTPYDYLVLMITLAPFLTGFLAYHQCFEYRTVIFLHILAGEIMLLTLPFTRLGHMIFFFLYRFLIDGEYSFVPGTRTW